MNSLVCLFVTPILKSLVVPVIWLALIGAIHSRIAPFFALNRIFSPANEGATLKTKQPIRFQGLFKVTNLIAGKWRKKSIVANFATFVSKTLILHPPPPPIPHPKKKRMILISNRLSTASIKCFNLLSPVFGWFQNGCNCRRLWFVRDTCQMMSANTMDIEWFT